VLSALGLPISRWAQRREKACSSFGGAADFLPPPLLLAPYDQGDKLRAVVIVRDGTPKEGAALRRSAARPHG
jgi:hypothetical protein